MKIIVAGCGKVGATIVDQLSNEGHEISVIDTHTEVIDKITTSYDVMGVVGNAASYGVQKEAGVENADLLIAVTNYDEVNMLCCLVAKKAGDCKTIARVRNPVYNQEILFFKDELGLSMIVNPELSAAKEISRILRSPNAINIETFSRGKIELTEFIIPEGSMLEGMSISDVRKKIQPNMIICAVERGDDVIIPNGSFVMKGKDIINFVAAPNDAKQFFSAIGLDALRIKDVMIAGGGTIAYYLTKMITAFGMRVKIIEKDKKACMKLTELNATIINGDATDQELLIEEGIESVDAFVSLTGMDEANIFLSLTAKEINPQAKTVTKSNHRSFVSIIGKLNMDAMVYPKDMTAESIVRYVRAMQNGMGSNVETLYKIIRGKVEALEFIIREDTEIRDIPLCELPIKPNILIAAIYRKGSVIYPDGQTVLMEGDRVVVITTVAGIDDIKDIVEAV